MTENESLLEFRKRYLGYRPGNLAKVRGEEMLLEFISWPYEENGEVLIKARPIDDPTGIGAFRARKDISPVRWGEVRQRAYRDGFKAGYGYHIELEDRARVECAERLRVSGIVARRRAAIEG